MEGPAAGRQNIGIPRGQVNEKAGVRAPPFVGREGSAYISFPPDRSPRSGPSWIRRSHRVITPLHAVLTVLAAFCVTWLVTRGIVVRSEARAGGEDVVTRLGGVAVLAGVTAGILGGLLATGYSGSLTGATRYHWIGWIAGAVTLFGGGLLDDMRGLRPRAKFAIQLAGAILVYLAGFRIESVAVPG